MRILFRIPLVLYLALVFILGAAASSNALPATPPGLVLWNKLGSQTEVLGSEVGASFAISSEPEVRFFPGVYGGAFGTEGGIWGYGGHLYMSPDNFFAPDKTRGTVEAWLQKRIPSVIGYVTAHVGIFGIQQYNCVPWVDPCDRDDYVPICARWDGADGMLGGGLVFTLVDAGGVWHDARDTGWNEVGIVPLYEWHHVAFVWDLAGIAGTADKMRIYRDGVLVAANTDNIAGLMVDNGFVKLLGNHEYRRTNEPLVYMDNLKVWDYARTDFSDRFVEGENRPPVAEADGDYYASEGDHVVLNGTASYDPDPGDTLTFAWDLDGDGVYGETGADAARGDEAGATPTFSAAGLNGPGFYTVSLRVTDRAGLSATDMATVNIMNASPRVDTPTVRPEPSVEGETVIAEATYTDPGSGESYTCTVDYGDADGPEPGTIHEDVCTGPAHTYLGSGTYTVAIVVRDQEGGVGRNSTDHQVDPSDVLRLGIGVEPKREDWTGIRQSMQKVSELGFHRALYYVDWADIQPAHDVLRWFELDTVVEQARACGVQPVLRIYHTPAWARPGPDVHAPANKEDLARFMTILVWRYATKVGGYVIWNEPNLPVGWENAQVDAAAYVDMLRSAYRAVKEMNRNAVVVSAGLAPTQGGDGAINDIEFLRQMYAAGLNDVADVVGMNGLGFASSPDDTSHRYGYNFSRLEQLRQVMVDNGGAARPAWALEVGWVADVPDDLGGFNWWKVSETRQAQYLKRAIEKADVQWPWLHGLFIWNLNFRYHSPQPEKSAFAIENRLAYQCVSQLQPPPAICDALPPSISLIQESADPINQQGCPAPTSVTIAAEVNDASGVAWVRLRYQPPEGTWMQLDMTWEQGNTYKAALGPFERPGTLSYYLEAQDGEGYVEQSDAGTVAVNGCETDCVDLSVRGFDPEADGLKFQNFFPEEGGGVNVGMSLTVMDYFSTATATLPITCNRWEGPRTWNPTNPLQAYVIWRHHNNLSAVSRYELASQTAQPLKEQRNALEYELVRHAIGQDNSPAVVGLLNEDWWPDRHTVVAYGIHDCPARNEFWIDVHDSNATAEGRVGLGRIHLARASGGPGPGIAVMPYDTEGYDQLYALSPTAVQAADPDTWYGGAATGQHATLHSQAVTAMQGQGFLPWDVYGGELDRGAASEVYTVRVHSGASFAVLVNWSGSILKLSIYKPDGTLFWEKGGAWPPLTAEVANPQGGDWTFRVTAVEVPTEDYPYVAVVGAKEQESVYLPMLLSR